MPSELSVSSKLTGKSVSEKADVKATEIAKLRLSGEQITSKQSDIKLDIQSIEKIDGGVQVFARAYKNGEQLGFGEDGTVDIERFRIFNPPILVDDPSGDIVIESTYFDIKTKQDVVTQRTLREDPEEAIRQTLAHTANLVGKLGTKIEAGKIGNTTTTLYPAAGANSPVDGDVRYEAAASYATAHNALTGTVADSTTDASPITTNYKASPSEWYVRRGFFGFDMTSIGTDTVSAVTFSAAGDGSTPENADSDTIEIVSATPASNSSLSTADFDQVGSTSYASLAVSSWVSTSGTYNDFTLDANGISYVDGNSGVFFLATRAGRDLSNTAPTGGNAVNCLHADYTGTSADPKLVVVHSAGGASGPANLKSLDTNVTANIKSYNTNLIANVKSINTNA